jgi:hypothetical protein
VQLPYLQLVGSHVTAARQDVGFGRTCVEFIGREDGQSYHSQKQEPRPPHFSRHPTASGTSKSLLPSASQDKLLVIKALISSFQLLKKEHR